MTAYLLDLGTVAYEEAWDLQRRLVDDRASDRIPDTLILVEHPHVITLGRKTSPANLRPQTIPVYRVERGGDATYHGPGQLVGYPIVKIHDHDVRGLVRRIERALLCTVQDFDIAGKTKEGHPGVWVDGKKLASIGVAVTGWVSYHGFALNVNTEMEYFDLIAPCGLDPSTMTSMERLLGREVDMAEVKLTVVREFARAFEVAYEPQISANGPNIK